MYIFQTNTGVASEQGDNLGISEEDLNAHQARITKIVGGRKQREKMTPRKKKPAMMRTRMNVLPDEVQEIVIPRDQSKSQSYLNDREKKSKQEQVAFPSFTELSTQQRVLIKHRLIKRQTLLSPIRSSFTSTIKSSRFKIIYSINANPRNAAKSVKVPRYKR
jgi:hypothetical protein